MSARRIGLGAAAAVVVATAAPAAAAPTWTAPQTLATGQEATVVAGSDGALLATWWARAGTMRGAARRAGGSWALLGTLRPRAFARPVALPAGRVLILSGGDPGTDGAIRAWSGPLRSRALRPVTIGHRNWDLPVGAVTSDGRAVAAWTFDQPRAGSGSNLRPRVVMVATRTRAGRWSAPRRISPLPPAPPYGNSRGPRLSATALAVAAGGRGVVVAAWRRVGWVEARVSRDAGHHWGKVVRLGRTTFAFPRFGVAVSPRGSFAVGWSTAPQVATGTRSLRTLLATHAPGGGFARPFELGRGTVTEDALAPAADQFGPRVALGYNPAGNGFVAWQSGEGARVGVRVARFAPGGSAPGALFLADAGAPAAVLGDLAAGAPGVAVSWADVTGTGAPGAVHVVTWPAAGQLGAAASVGSGSGPRLAVTGTGLQAIWTGRDGGRQVVQAAQAATLR